METRCARGSSGACQEGGIITTHQWSPRRAIPRQHCPRSWPNESPNPSSRRWPRAVELPSALTLLVELVFRHQHEASQYLSSMVIFPYGSLCSIACMVRSWDLFLVCLLGCILLFLQWNIPCASLFTSSSFFFQVCSFLWSRDIVTLHGGGGSLFLFSYPTGGSEVRGNNGK